MTSSRRSLVGAAALLGLVACNQPELGPGTPPPADEPIAEAANAVAEVEGQWTAPFFMPLDGLHAHLLPTGKVLFFGYEDGTYLWDPATGRFRMSAPFSYNPFGAGHNFMPDGKLFVTGGHNNINSWGLWNASIFDPATETWKMVPDMNDGRWYPSNVTLPSGDILVIAGQTVGAQFHDQLAQVWETQAGKWRDLTSAVKKVSTYPHLHVLPDGRVAISGPDLTTLRLDPSGTGAWDAVVPTMKFGNRSYGTAIQYAPGKLIAIGGGSFGAAVPTDIVETIDMNQASPKWAKLENQGVPFGYLNYPRQLHNSVLLPDGKILTIGGSGGSGFNNENYPVYPAEIWDPATQAWTVVASNSVYRAYHSIGLLLPDATVLSSSGVGHENGEIYSPPYLFHGPRPTITKAPDVVDYGETFLVETPDAASVAKISMLRLGSVTHCTNSDQRINFLPFVATQGGLLVDAIDTPNLGPPGHYMLFLLNTDGVPSTAKIFRIGAGMGTSPLVPRPPTDLTVKYLSGTSVKMGWRDESSNEDGFRIEGSYPSGNWAKIASVGPGVTSYVHTDDVVVGSGKTIFYRVRAYNAAGHSPYTDKTAVVIP